MNPFLAGASPEIHGEIQTQSFLFASINGQTNDKVQESFALCMTMTIAGSYSMERGAMFKYTEHE